MGQLTASDSALLDPRTQQPTFIGSPRDVLAQANARLQQSQQGTSIPELQGILGARNPDVALPSIGRPSFLQAAQSGAAPGSVNALSPGLSRMGKLAVFLSQGLQGAMQGLSAQAQGIAASGGRWDPGIGPSFTSSAYEMPFLRALRAQQLQRGAAETSIAQTQAQLYPQIATLGARKTLADIGKSEAQAQEAGAKAGGQGYVNALNEAKAAAERYKEVGGVLYDVSGGAPQPVQSVGQFVPADQQMAAAAQIPVGTKLPLATASKLKQMANEGIVAAQANGRSLLVDKTGKTIADLGVATPILSSQIRVEGLSNLRMSSGIDTQTGQPAFVTPAMMRAEPGRYIPAQTDAELQSKLAAARDFASGNAAKNVRSLNTAIGHLRQLQDASEALGNNNLQLMNKVANAVGVQAGKTPVVAFNSIKNAVQSEVAAVFKASGATDQEISSIGATFSAAQSPDQMRAAILQTVGLLHSRLGALQFQYQQATGGQRDLLSPESKKALQEIQGGSQAGPTSPATGLQLTRPRPGVVVEQ